MEPAERRFNEQVAGNPQVSWAFSPLCVLWEACARRVREALCPYHSSESSRYGMKHVLFAREHFHFSHCEPGAMRSCWRSLGHTLCITHWMEPSLLSGKRVGEVG